MSNANLGKKILDACCGSRMFWFDRQNPDVVFADIRSESHILCDGRELHVKPDVISDFKQMPFEDESFKLVVFDPPHLKKIGVKSWMFKKYGSLSSTWQDDLRRGINECMRVLKPDGILIFKWNEAQITLPAVLKELDHKPLFGHVTGKHGKTIWMTFMKPSKVSVPES
jgi:ubiquinone/menaquinone biosynthesis C-methylase UbiE